MGWPANDPNVLRLLASGQAVDKTPARPVLPKPKRSELVERSFIAPGTWVIPLYLEPATNGSRFNRSMIGRAGKHRREVSRSLAMHLRELAEFQGKAIRCRITRIGRTMDDDNIAAAAKHARDTVAMFLGVDDGPSGPIRWEYDQEPSNVVGLRIKLEVM